jgi:hypothetical protein
MGRRMVRAAATTAVVAGTAGAVRHHQQQKWANQDADQNAEMQAAYEQGQMDAMQQQQQMAPPPPAPAAAPAAASDDISTKIQELAQLHAQGILTDEDFAAAKAKVLAG